MREAQEVTRDLEVQENKEVLQQSQSNTDQTKRWSKGNGIGSSNTTGKGESQQDPKRNPHYGENSQLMIYNPHPSKDGWAPREGRSQELESEGEETEKECGTIRKCPFLWGEGELGGLKGRADSHEPREKLLGVSSSHKGKDTKALQQPLDR